MKCLNLTDLTLSTYLKLELIHSFQSDPKSLSEYLEMTRFFFFLCLGETAIALHLFISKSMIMTLLPSKSNLSQVKPFYCEIQSHNHSQTN